MLRAILETYPPGHARAGELRYRSVVVSMGRQNGKTEIGAVLGLWGLLRAPNAFTVGLASNKEQADLIYARARKAIEANPTLRARFKRTTGTRGLQTHTGSIYRVSAATSAALQGVPIHTALVDELHILPEELWADVLNGTGARPNTLVVGITTAGSESSTLLKRLYENGEKAVSGDPAFERFGFFRWEAPEARVPDDDATLLEYLYAANPALSSGRLDPDTVLADVRTLGKAEIIRYRLNRFVGSTDSFIDLHQWGTCQREAGASWPSGTPYFAVDWTQGREHASISVAVRDEKGTVHTELVETINNPTQEGIIRSCAALNAQSPGAFVFNTSRLREVGNEMKRQGYPVSFYSPADLVRASNTFYARVARGTVRHAGDPLIALQLPKTVRREVGEDYRISSKDSKTHVDAVIATVMAVHAAEVTPDNSLAIF